MSLKEINISSASTHGLLAGADETHATQRIPGCIFGTPNLGAAIAYDASLQVHDASFIAEHFISYNVNGGKL